MPDVLVKCAGKHAKSLMEVELKLRLDRDDVPSLRRHPLIAQCAQGRPKTRTLTSVYFDTPGILLARHGVALRVRRAGRAFMQTLKAGGGEVGGLHARGEWESSVARLAPDLVRLREHVAAPEVVRVLSRRRLVTGLAPVFETRFRRTSWNLHMPGGGVVEAALDIGEIRSADRNEPVCELELELKEGDPATLFDVALTLLDGVSLTVETRTKAARGYALSASREADGTARRPRAIVVDAEATVGDALRAIAGGCIAQMRANESAVRLSAEHEAVHQMRVALRRLRFATRLFAEAAPCPDLVRDELRWLAGELGAARDWQVLSSTTLPPVFDDAAELPGVASMLRAVDQQVASASAQAETAVASRRYVRLLLQLGRWLAPGGGDGVDDLRLSQPVRTFAATALSGLRKRCRHAAARAANGGAGERHKWRIAVKKLRYAVEFFAPLYDDKRVNAYVRSLIALQDVLGAGNDSVVALRLIATLAVADDEAVGARRFAEGYLHARADVHAGVSAPLRARHEKLALPWKD